MSLDPRIVEADQVMDVARKAWNDVVSAVQAQCPHLTAVERPYKSDWLGYTPARRVCTTCGLAEDEKYGWKTITTQFVKRVSHHDDADMWKITRICSEGRESQA